jgi:hypothetical protein
VRRSVSPTSKSLTESLTRGAASASGPSSGRRGAGSPVRSSALRTVAGVSIACSSPKLHGRVLPVYSPVLVVVPGAALGQVGEHPAQRGVAEPADGLRGELQLAVGPLQVPLPLQFPFDLAQRFHVVDGLAAERAPDRLLVDVVQPGAGVVLAQRILELGQVGEFGERGGRLAEAERRLAGHSLAWPSVEVDVRAAGPQPVGQPAHLGGQPGVLERLRHQRGQLVALGVGERAEQPLRSGHPSDQ